LSFSVNRRFAMILERNEREMKHALPERWRAVVIEWVQLRAVGIRDLGTS
jgi:hypothetical protein